MRTPTQHEVPTHLDVEDKVVFGLTVRQFLYLLVGSSASYALWSQAAVVSDGLRLAGLAIVLTATLALAFARPADRALEEWLVAGLRYVGSARRATWQPLEPIPEQWRPSGAGWQELTPSLVWAEGEPELAPEAEVGPVRGERAA